jgi:tetratricopeptide (TPR) repeat protein
MAGILVSVVTGCATTSSSPGRRLLRAADYPAAAEALRTESDARPNDLFLRRDYAVALLEAGRAADAVGPLRELRLRLPRDPQIAFHLGHACESVSDFDGALAAYQDYLTLGGKGRDQVAARLHQLSLRRIEAEVKRAVAREDSLAGAVVPENAVAVPDFTNPAAVDSLAPLGRGLAALLIPALSHVDALRVVERARLRVLLDELDLTGAPTAPPPSEAEVPDLATAAGVWTRLQRLPRSDSKTPYYQGAGAEGDPALREAVRAFQSDHGLEADGKVGPRTRQALAAAWANRTPAAEAARPVPLIDAALAPRVGHLLGARRFVQGSFLPLADARVQLDAGIMDIAGGLLVGAGEPVQGRLPEILRLEKTLGVAILEALGVPVDAAVRRALGEPATDDFRALLSFSRGLVFEDQGRFEDAAADYRLAVERSPSFAEAAERLRITSVGAAEQKSLDRSEVRRLAEPISLPAGAVERQVGALGLGPLPGGDGGSPDSPTPNDATRSDPTVRMVIEGDIPGGNP